MNLDKYLEGPGNTIPYEQNRTFGDRFLPQVKQILGGYLIRKATEEEDCLEATDLRVLTVDIDFRIAVRIRRPGYAKKFGHQFTIRSLPAPTEYHKVRAGWGDWFFYGHAKDDRTLGLWWLVNLESWRYAVKTFPAFDRNGDIPNFDDRNTHLRAYSVFELIAYAGKQALIGSSHRLDRMSQYFPDAYHQADDIANNLPAD